MKKKLSQKEVLTKASLAVIASLFFVFALWAQDQPPATPPAPESKTPPATAPAPESKAPPATAPAPESKAPPEAPAKANPVKPTPESIAKGKKTYGVDCEMCHGKDGDGKGDMASDMKNVTDFTNPDAMKSRSDGDLFNIIRKGKGEMPPEGDRAKNDDIWNLVNYIRSLAKK